MIAKDVKYLNALLRSANRTAANQEFGGKRWKKHFWRELERRARNVRVFGGRGFAVRHARRRYVGILIFVVGGRKGTGCNPLDKRLPPPLMPLDKQGPSFSRAAASNETVAVRSATRKKRSGRIFPRGGYSGSNPSSFAALCRRNKLLVLPARLSSPS